jgi:hypothetical protein
MRKLMLAAALSFATLAGCSTSEGDNGTAKKKDEIPSMTVDEVDKGIAAKQLQAVDCNHDDLRKKLGVVPGAILVADTHDYAASLLPADKTAKLVFYCADPG